VIHEISFRITFERGNALRRAEHDPAASKSEMAHPAAAGCRGLADSAGMVFSGLHRGDTGAIDSKLCQNANVRGRSGDL